MKRHLVLALCCLLAALPTFAGKTLIASELGIVGDGVSNIAITGSGLIDGNGRALALNIDSLLNIPTEKDSNGPPQRRRASEPLRPKLFFFSNCDNVHIDGLQLKNSACWGLSFHSCKNLTVENIAFENRAYWNNDGIDVTDCKDVVIRHCDIDYDLRGPGFSVYNPRPSSITGIPGHHVEDVTLEDIELIYPGRASKGIWYYPLSQIHQVPEKIRDYPEFSMFGELPAWGFYVRHVRGLTFRNVRLSLKDEDFRPAFVFDDARGVTLRLLSLPLHLSGQPWYGKDSQVATEE